MTKFTKGEWKISGNAIGIIDQSDTQSNGMMNIISYIDMFDFKDDWKANAHLIAAAPEMYEMIKNLSKELELAITKINVTTMKNVTPQTETPPDLWDMESLHDAQVLLAKARGELL